jgi:hypothetical protein
MTGSGKTFLMQNYLPGFNVHKFILDTKGEFNWKEVPQSEQILIQHLKDLPFAVKNYKNIIYRPAREELTFEHYNAFFEFCYYLKNCIVAVDEVMSICPNASRIPEFYKGILTRGRELNVAVWSLTQRPATIPILIYDQATHWFVFKLNNIDDRTRLVKHSGYKEFLQPLDRYVFLYLILLKVYHQKPGNLF